MISNNDLKQKLLETDMFIENVSLDKYIDLIIANINTQMKIDVTQKHHIIPRYYYIHRNLSIDNSKQNQVNLPISDHIKAHYYLYNCVKDSKEKYSNLYALRRMLGGRFTDLSKIETLSDEECLDLYKNYNELNRQAHQGKSRKISDETKAKISAANSDKYHDYKYIHDDSGSERRVPEAELQHYLDSGWILGRSEKSIASLKAGYNYNSKGMLGKKQSDFQKDRARKALLGKSKSIDAKKNMSLARLGKKLYINPETGKGKYLSQDEINAYINKGWYKK